MTLAHKLKLSQHIDLHLVLNAGAPVTKAIRQCRRFCMEDGVFVFSRECPTFRLSNSEKSALADVIQAQIARCRRGFRLPLTHMDSHGNVINLPNRELLEESVQRLPGYDKAESFSGHRYNSTTSGVRSTFMGE